MTWKDIPIIINAKDRKSCLEALLSRLAEHGMISQTIVLDTGSTYPPMVEFLNRLPCRLIRFIPKGPPQNAVWEADDAMQAELRRNIAGGEGWYVYTDCDCVPECDPDWLEKFYATAQCHTQYPKLGFGLNINNLPDHYSLKGEVIKWESQFWSNPLNSAWYIAPIDTTLALYRPGAAFVTPSLRSAPPYLARHLPWYYDSSHPTEEWIYYLDHLPANLGHWSGTEKQRRNPKPPDAVAGASRNPKVREVISSRKGGINTMRLM